MRPVVCWNDTGRGAAALCLLSASAALALAACATEVEDPRSRGELAGEAALEIKDGYSDSDDRAVTGLLITDRTGQVARTCSSTLIAPNLVLTAQHCIADAPKLISCKTATFGEPVDPAQVYVTLGDSMWTGDTPWIAAQEVLRPADGNAVCGRDIALVVLGSPVRGSEATPFAPRLDRPPEAGEVYSAIGFGDTEGGERDGGKRRRRDGLVIECVGYGCGAGQRIAGSEWRGETGSCSGDSGGPALDEAGRVIGVTSRGPTGCADPIYGGIIAHRDWMIKEAGRAAEAGGYGVPAWAGASSWTGILPSRRPIDDRWTSCAYRPVDGGAGSSEAMALALLAALSLGRKVARAAA
jgi:hypothetical protein